MVYRWRCRHCDFSVWASTRTEITRRVKRHILSHSRQNITEGEFQLQWECPYCDRTGQSHERPQGIETYRDHLFGHVEALLESGVHVADDIGRTGNILVLSSLESTGANNARIHFLSPCDIVVLVTTNPAARIQLIQEELPELPAWIVVLTTREKPLDGLSEQDLSVLPLEVVQLDKQMGLAGLGETVSRVLTEQEKMAGKISFEFDILSELVDTFTLQSVFQFLHILTARLDEADALSHYYFDPETQYEGSANVLNQMFDMRIRATEGVFTSSPGPALER